MTSVLADTSNIFWVFSFEVQVDSDDIQLPDGVSLPLQDEASVDAFDNILRADAELRKSLVNKYYHKGVVVYSTNIFVYCIAPRVLSIAG